MVTYFGTQASKKPYRKLAYLSRAHLHEAVMLGFQPTWKHHSCFLNPILVLLSQGMTDSYFDVMPGKE